MYNSLHCAPFWHNRFHGIVYLEACGCMGKINYRVTQNSKSYLCKSEFEYTNTYKYGERTHKVLGWVVLCDTGGHCRECMPLDVLLIIKIRTELLNIDARDVI